VHEAADGGLVRVRLPGGQVDPEQLRALAGCARDHSDGTLDLTSRGNVQLRGIPDAEHARRLADRLADAGLLPTPTHERVRNIVASPLSGRDGRGARDVREMVWDLDAAVRGAAELAALSGRFLFALDDGRGDVAGLGADVCWRAGANALLLAGVDVGMPVTPDDAVPAMVAAATAFLRLRADRTDLWRLADLPDGPARVAATLAAPAPARAPGAGLVTAPNPADPAPRVGPYRAGFVVAAVRLGRLLADQAELLATVAGEVAGGGVVVTPWRSVVLDVAATSVVKRLAAGGLILDPASPWIGVSACTGRPGCASALADVRADAAAAIAERSAMERSTMERSTMDDDRPRLHWVGCERACGRPRGPVTVAVATGDGYRMVRE
jgi:precorrin-3B synthase